LVSSPGWAIGTVFGRGLGIRRNPSSARPAHTPPQVWGGARQGEGRRLPLYRCAHIAGPGAPRGVLLEESPRRRRRPKSSTGPRGGLVTCLQFVLSNLSSLPWRPPVVSPTPRSPRKQRAPCIWTPLLLRRDCWSGWTLCSATIALGDNTPVGLSRAIIGTGQVSKKRCRKWLAENIRDALELNPAAGGGAALEGWKRGKAPETSCL